MEVSQILVCWTCLLNKAGVKAGEGSIPSASAIFMFKKKKSLYFEPNYGPIWEWILVIGVMWACYPVWWFLKLFMEEQKAYKIAFVPLNALNW